MGAARPPGQLLRVSPGESLRCFRPHPGAPFLARLRRDAAPLAQAVANAEGSGTPMRRQQCKGNCGLLRLQTPHPLFFRVQAGARRPAAPLWEHFHEKAANNPELSQLCMKLSQLYMNCRFPPRLGSAQMKHRDVNVWHGNPRSERAGISGVANQSATRGNIQEMNSTQNSGTAPFYFNTRARLGFNAEICLRNARRSGAE